MGDLAARVTPETALDRFFAADYRRRPVTATFTGVHEFDGQLPDWSRAGLDAAVADMRATRTELREAGSVADEDVRRFPDQVDLALADAHLEVQAHELQGSHFQRGNPSLWTGEAIFGVLSLVTRDFAPVGTRLAAAAERMQATPAFLAAARDTLERAPASWREKAIRECDAADILFGRSLPHWAAASCARAAEAERFIAGCATAREAFASFRQLLEHGLPGGDEDAPGAGEPTLSLLLRRGHWCTTSIDDLLAEATAALEEAHTALARQVHENGFRTWAEAQDAIAAAHPTADQYLPRFAHEWERCYRAVVNADIVTWPERPIRYVPIPRHTRDAAPLLYYLFYRSPAPFDRLPVHDYVVTPLDGADGAELERRLRAANDSTILLNHVVHHGGLGHHVQNAHADQSRSRIGQVAAVDAASRISMFGGGTMAEGWACYACDVAEELELLTPLDRLAQQHTRVRLAARAVADLSLHTHRLSLEDTARFYESRGLMPSAAARAEAIKNAMFPGAAVMYWLGTRDIHRLRAATAAREASRFSLKRFHDRFLSFGAIPVRLIARLMDGEHTAC